MVMQHRWTCSWPWLTVPTHPAPRPDCHRPPRVDLRKLLDRATVADSGSSAGVQENTKVWLPSPPLVEKPRAVHNAASLAYLGDAIYEVYVRRHFLTPPQNIDSYNKRVMSLVCCEAQVYRFAYYLPELFSVELFCSTKIVSLTHGVVDVYNRFGDAMLQQLLTDKILSHEERDVVRWGKNIETGQRRASRRAGSRTYSSASALETLIGYLYLSDQQRLDELMAIIGFNFESSSLQIGFGFQTTD